MKRILLVLAFALAAAIGAGIGVGVTQRVYEKRARAAQTANDQQIKQISERADLCQVRLNAATLAVMGAHNYDDFLTVLYERGPAPTSAPLELLNVVRPGLGTAIAKLQPPQSVPGLTVHWVLTGNSKVISGPRDSATGQVSISSIRDGWIANPVPGQPLPQ